MNYLTRSHLKNQIIPISPALECRHGTFFSAALLKPRRVAILVVIKLVVWIIEERFPEFGFEIIEARCVCIRHLEKIQHSLEGNPERAMHTVRRFNLKGLSGGRDRLKLVFVRMIEIEVNASLGTVILGVAGGADHWEVIQLVNIHQRASLELVLNNFFPAFLKPLEDHPVTGSLWNGRKGALNNLFFQFLRRLAAKFF